MQTLESRIVEAYRVAERRDGERGSKAWFARLCGVDATTVTRWISGESPPDRAEGVLVAFWTGYRAGLQAAPPDIEGV